jgi:hypothetical protein
MEDELDIQDLLNAAINGDVADLERSFDAVVRSKINHAIEYRKQELAQNLGHTDEDE